MKDGGKEGGMEGEREGQGWEGEGREMSEQGTDGVKEAGK